MNFFDRATNAMENMGKNVSKVAKDNVEIAKCTSAIKSCEEKLNSVYAEIGKKYYHSKPEVSRETFSALFDVIQQYQNQIDDLRKRLQELKGITICKSCGAELSRGAKFCRSCGAQQIVQPEIEPATTVCWNCHSPLTGSERFCTVCGANLNMQPGNGNNMQFDNSIQPANEEIQMPAGQPVAAEQPFTTEAPAQAVTETQNESEAEEKPNIPPVE